MMMKKGIQAYKAVGLKNELPEADPHRVIQMLYSGLLDKLAYAKGCIERRDFVGKSEHISKAIGILTSLQTSLDMKAGGEISANLFELYAFMVDRLSEATVKNDTAMIDEVARTLIPIKEAWDQIPEEAKAEGYRQRQQLGELDIEPRAGE